MNITTDSTKAHLAAFLAFIVGRLEENATRGEWESVKPESAKIIAKLARKLEKLAASLAVNDQRGIRRHSADLAAWALKAFTLYGTPDETARLAAALGREIR